MISQAYNKFYVAALSALVTAGTLATGKITFSTVVAIIVSFAGALGVVAIPNVPPKT